MSRKIPYLFVLFLCVACNVESPPEVSISPQETHEAVESNAQPEDILIHNGRIYTMDQALPATDAMLFDSSGRIHKLGEEQAMLDAYPDAEHIDLKGKTVIPGLIDSHAHLFGLAGPQPMVLGVAVRAA